MGSDSRRRKAIGFCGSAVRPARLVRPCTRISAIIADFKSVHATYAAYMQPCDRHDPSLPERPRTAGGPVSEEKWLFGEFGERPRTLANIDYWCFVISRSVVRETM